jgi:sulfur carrier protein
VRLLLNGQSTDVDDGTSLPALIESLGLRVGSVVVEHNGTALLRSEVVATTLSDGDSLELVRAVAGG